MKKRNCDMCLDKSEIIFSITDDALFYACAKHAKKLSDLIYPIGDALMAEKMPLLMKALATPTTIK